MPGEIQVHYHTIIIMTFYPRETDIGHLAVEGRFPKETIDELLKKGHKVSVDSDWSLGRMTAASMENQILKAARLQSTDHHPRWAIAHKFPAERAVTKIIDIDIQVGRTGVLTPVARLQPISIVAWWNLGRKYFEEIQRKDIRIGDMVWVQRAGDVIPQVISAIKEKRLENLSVIDAPSHCPVCGSIAEKELVLSGNTKKYEKYIRCMGGFSCDAQAIERIKHFSSKAAFDIEGLGQKQIDDYFINKMIKSPVDIFFLEDRYKSNPPSFWQYTSGPKEKNRDY